MKEISKKEAEGIIYKYDFGSFTDEEIGTFYFYDNENKKYIGIDNRTCDCWVEEFDTLKECIDWLDEGVI